MADGPESPPAQDPGTPSDVVLLTGPTADGEGIKVVRARGERLDAGGVRPLKEGRPLGTGEIVKLEPKRGPGDGHVRPDRGNGPPKVATDAYRESWERIFGGPEGNRALN